MFLTPHIQLMRYEFRAVIDLIIFGKPLNSLRYSSVRISLTVGNDKSASIANTSVVVINHI